MYIVEKIHVKLFFKRTTYVDEIDEFVLFQVLWTFSIYLEAVAILPQLFMLSKTGEAETITSHYLFALGLYRALYIVNWVGSFDLRLFLYFSINKINTVEQ